MLFSPASVLWKLVIHCHSYRFFVQFLVHHDVIVLLFIVSPSEYKACTTCSSKLRIFGDARREKTTESCVFEAAFGWEKTFCQYSITHHILLQNLNWCSQHRSFILVMWRNKHFAKMWLVIHELREPTSDEEDFSKSDQS